MPRGVRGASALQTPQTPEVGEMPQSAAPIMEPALSPRAAEVRRERRRREDGDIDRMARFNLAVPREIEERAKREGKVLRWMVNQPGRLIAAQDDDWDKVPGIGHVAAGPDTDEKLVLMEKYKDWHEDDMTADQRIIDEQERSIVRGDSDLNRSEGVVPVADSARNRISRDRG